MGMTCTKNHFIRGMTCGQVFTPISELKYSKVTNLRYQL